MSSFKRRTPKNKRSSGKNTTTTNQLPNGTSYSIHNGQLLISSGLRELDEICSGGFSVGSLNLLEQDENTGYAQTLLEYFCVEGLESQQNVCYAASGDKQSSTTLFFENLPQLASQQVIRAERAQKSAHLKIAWRYQDQVNSSKSSSINGGEHHFYDLSKRRDLCSSSFAHQLDNLNDDHYDQMFQMICAKLKQLSQQNPRCVTRIVLSGFFSPLFFSSSSSGQRHALVFLQRLKGLLRFSLATAMISWPAHLYGDSSFVQRVRHISDVSVAIRSFAGSGDAVSEIFEDFTGMFYVHRMPRLNSLLSHMPQNPTFVYTRKRRKLLIESIHLPPEFSRSTKKKTAAAIKEQKETNNQPSKKTKEQLAIDF